MLEKENVDVKLVEGEGIFHIYPLFPMPEAKKAFKEKRKEWKSINYYSNN